MAKMIQLTSLAKTNTTQKAREHVVFINPNYIVLFYEYQKGTVMYLHSSNSTKDKEIYVKESPAEIMDLLNQ